MDVMLQDWMMHYSMFERQGKVECASSSVSYSTNCLVQSHNIPICFKIYKSKVIYLPINNDAFEGATGALAPLTMMISFGGLTPFSNVRILV